MKKIISLLAICIFLLTAICVFPTVSFSQDLRFAQPFANPLKLNPAMMGMNEDLKFMLHYRSQWAALGNGYTTASFTTLYPIYIKEGKEKLDVGANVLQDKSGAFKSLDASLAIGYNLQISDAGHLNFSLMGGYVQKSLNTANLTFDNQYMLGSYNSSNPINETVLNNKAGYADVGAGAMWYYTPSKDDNAKLNAYLGVSAFHLNQPNESFTAATGKLPARYSFQGGIKILGKNKIDFTPNVIVNSQNGNENIAVGVLMDYHVGEATSKIVIGAWYRRTDAIAFSVGYEHKTLSFGYSYDVVTSQISNSVAGLNAHEITVALKFNQSHKGNSVPKTGAKK
ncbi:MAG: PorP/SprF family type IX secretion system membrane protein [Bacteroidetes bacterium]|nr:PorP/SprF family type IX secretion system membrane protein [Bacteroidota bacterium]